MKSKNSIKLELIICLLFVVGFTNTYSQNISVSGIINNDTEWIVDTVTVTADVYIPNGIKLTIYPGAFIRFAGDYEISVQGCIQALGTYSAPIIFTIINNSEFSDTLKTNGGWQGFRFDKTNNSNDISKFINCEFSYAKAVGANSLDRNGGVI